MTNLRERLGGPWRRLGLRGRVLALVLALLLVSSGVLFLATTFALRSFLVSRLDQQVAEARMTYAQSLEGQDQDADNVEAFVTEGQAPDTVGARVSNGQVVAGGLVRARAMWQPLAPADQAAIVALRPREAEQTVHLPGLGEYRVSVRASDDGDVLVAGLPLEGVDDTVRKLAFIELMVFAVVLALTGLIGGRLVRRSLRPLTDLTHTARTVSDMPLAEGDVALHARVPGPAPGTEMGEVADAFNHMLDHVAAALTARQRSEGQLRQFVADASHELRTPVSVIKGHAEYAQREQPDLPAETVGSLRRIDAEATRMSVLVDNLLLLARLDAGQPAAHDEVDLTLLVIDAVGDARVTDAEHSWDLDLPEDSVTVFGDAHGLHRAVANLLGNAVRHTPAGTTVSVSVAASGGQVRLDVCDDGPGIPPEVLPHVFERFVRGDGARTRAADSTGLGLAIVDAVVRAHGGTVSVTSEPGATDFTVLLPSAD